MAEKQATPKKISRKTGTDCDCFSLVNNSLEEQGINTRLKGTLQMSFKTGKSRMLPVLEVEKADSKKREATKTIIPKYCPICGKKYSDL